MPAKKAVKKSAKKSAKKTPAKRQTKPHATKKKDQSTLDKVASAAKKHGKEIVETVKATPGVVAGAISKTVDTISEAVSPSPTTDIASKK